MSSIHFLGAAGTVTGSRHLVEHEGHRILLDCGLFQGEKSIRSHNWDRFAVPADTIEVVVISHAHIDHTGWLPRLVKEGFRGKVFCTPATADLAAIMLPDSGHLQEEEARFANKKQYSKHTPALPLYTEEDAVRCLRLLRRIEYAEPQTIAPGVDVTFHRAGHILGSATVQLDLKTGTGVHRLLFSGDLGRYDIPILLDPEPPVEATTLMIECTYGDRLHAPEHPATLLEGFVREMLDRRAVMVVPAFAIGRTQDVLYHLRQLQLADKIPSIPIYVDSPMACDATPLYLAHREEHDPQMVKELVEGRRPLEPSFLKLCRSVEESKALNEKDGPMIIISASGMATGGRVLHHLTQRLPNPRNMVVFTGYQAVGSRGRKLLEGATEIPIHGQVVPVRASIHQIPGFSAHADYAEMDRWLAPLKTPPRTTYCVHGEPEGLEATRARLAARGWNVRVPKYLERFDL